MPCPCSSSSRAKRGISAKRTAEIPRLRLGMTCCVTPPAARNDVVSDGALIVSRRTLCQPESLSLSSRAKRGISALRMAEIPRLRLGMTSSRQPRQLMAAHCVNASRSACHPERSEGSRQSDALRFLAFGSE
jgi:hypothetical protein